MSDIFPSKPLPRDPISNLVAAISDADFGERLLAHVRGAAPVANIGAFLVPAILYALNGMLNGRTSRALLWSAVLMVLVLATLLSCKA